MRLASLVKLQVFVAAYLAAGMAHAQSIDVRQWQGSTAKAREAEQVIATTIGEWRSLWTRAGAPPPDLFEPGRTHAVGVFLGTRSGNGYAVNILSTSRRRDRIVVVFEERAPAEVMQAQRAAPTTRNVAASPGPPSGASSFAAPSASASVPLSAPASPGTRPTGATTSPWAIVLINRADLPVVVEQRWFR